MQGQIEIKISFINKKGNLNITHNNDANQNLKPLKRQLVFMITDDTDQCHHVFVELARSNDIDKGSFSRVLKILNKLRYD